MPIHTLTLTLSRFAVEGTPAEQSHNRAPSTAQRERVGVRVCGSFMAEYARYF